MLMKLIEKLLANYIELPFVYTFYFMFSMFMPLSSIRWFYIMIAISVVSLFFVCAHLYFDIKNKKTKRSGGKSIGCLTQTYYLFYRTLPFTLIY